jgi:Prealbumin-like fold domain
MSLGNIRQRPVRRRWVFGITTAAVAAVMVLVVASASGVLTGSPNKFEGGNDPTIGLGNMIVNTAGDTDWASPTVTGSPNYFTATDPSNSQDDSFVSGQKQDTVCPDLDPAHGNPPKDDFTNVASFTETNAAGQTYLYGATIRVAPNGTASENIELKQGTAGACPNSPGLLARVAGDKLLAIDYNGGGAKVSFHVLTWIETQSEPCFVSNDAAPCWGSTVLTLGDVAAEGGVNGSDIPAAQNSISNSNIKAGQFAEFGVNLDLAGILPASTCKAFPQTIWESRSSTSFVSTTKDIKIENKIISNCGQITIIKRTNPRGANQAFPFTSNITTATAGSELTCVSDSTPDSFSLNDNGNTTTDSAANTEDCTKVRAGSYTVTEGADPTGWTFESLSCTATAGSSATTSGKVASITLAADGHVTCVYTNKPLKGALKILKNSTKGGAVKRAGAVFSYDGSSVTDNGAGDEDPAVGSVCVSNLNPGTYTVSETTPPPGYGPATGGPQSVTVVADTNCAANPPGPGATATFTNPPLSDIQVRFRDGGSTETSATISCDNTTGTPDDANTTGWDKTHTVTGIDAPTTIHCTIEIDP